MKATDRRHNERRLEASVIDLERRRLERRNKDRRSAERLNLELWMEEISGDDIYIRRCGNVSAGGVFLDQAIPQPVGTVLTLKFALPGELEMLVARGTVVSAAHGEALGMGIKFVSFEGDGQQRLRQYLQS